MEINSRYGRCIMTSVIMTLAIVKVTTSEEMVEGCIGSQLNLNCSKTNSINILSVTLGHSSGCADTNCCPRNDICTANPNASHVQEVHSRCNGRQTCSVDVIRENITCEHSGIYAYNDFGRITYECIIANYENMVQVCVGSQLTLTCNGTKVINVSSVVLGDSWCKGTYCCPTSDSCIRNPNANHVNDVHNRCNGQQTCSVDVITESISCGFFGNSNNDFERIAYDCIGNGNYSTTQKTQGTGDDKKVTVEWSTSMNDMGQNGSMSPEGSSDTTVPIIIVIICLIVLIIVIVLVVIIIKRKRSWSKTKSEVEMSDVRRNVQNDTIYMNSNQEQNGIPSSSLSPEIHRDNGTTSAYEKPNDVIEYSVVSKETPEATEGTGVEYSTVDIITKSDHQNPATKSGDSGDYSLAGDPYGPQNNNSALESVCDDNVYDEVEPKQSGKATQPHTTVSNRDNDKKTPKKTMDPSGQSKTPQEFRPYANIDSSGSNSKAGEGIYKNAGELESVSSTSPNYEPMTPVLCQSIYANESAVGPDRLGSVTSSVGGGSETSNPYCEMRSPSVKSKDDGAHLVIDNELYSQ